MEATRRSLNLGKRDYQGNFPLFAYPREDKYWRVGASLQNLDIKLWERPINFNFSYIVNNSNIALYDYDAADCQIGWSVRF